MDTKAILSCQKKLNELASQHNKLTTLTAVLLNEITSLKREVVDLKSNDNHQPSSSHRQSSNSNQKYANFNELKAEDILKQLSINTPDN
jgi:hypothetical protein